MLKVKPRLKTNRLVVVVHNGVSVLGLVGLSFSGSTVLNYVLGAHDGVYGGSEIYRLIDPDPELRSGCSWCRGQCAVLTDERIAAMNKDNFYSALAEHTGKKKIVDTSKTLAWFEDIFPRQARQGVSLRLALLTKHPLRQLAAFIGWQNDYLYKCGMRSVIKRMLVDPTTAFSKTKMHVSYWLDVATDFYDEFAASPLLAEVPSLSVKYEDFVEHPAKALDEILSGWGLGFDPYSIDYSSFEQHGVGGNGGVTRMVDPELRMKRLRERGKGYILDYYKKCKGLTMDNTYLDAFSREEIEWISSLSKFKSLCERLSYEPTI